MNALAQWLARLRERWAGLRAQPAGDELANARITRDLPKTVQAVRSDVAGEAFEIAQFHIQIWISIVGGFFAVWLSARRERSRQI